MSLAANRTEHRRLDSYPIPPASNMPHYPSDSVFISTGYWDHPMGLYSLVIDQTTISTFNGLPLRKDVETWLYDGAIIGDSKSSMVPTRYTKKTYADVRLPRVQDWGALLLVETLETTYWYEDGWRLGPPSKRTVKRGYVIYDVAPAVVSQSSIDQDILARRHAIAATGASDLLPDSAKGWETALRSAAISERADANQRAVWLDPWTVDEEIVRDDTIIIRKWSVFKDYTKPGPPEVRGPEETRKNVTVTIPLYVQPPKIKVGNAGFLGVRIEIKGGGAILETVLPVPEIAKIPAERYRIFRKDIGEPPLIEEDTYGIHNGPITAEERLSFAALSSSVTDFGGGGADGLPPVETYTEEDDDTPPLEDGWTQVADVDNQEPDRRRPARAVYFDPDVLYAGAYEYYAIAIVGDTESTDSNHEAAGCMATPDGFSALTVTADRGAAQNGLEITISYPRPGIMVVD